MFREWHPSPEELIASGEGANFDLHGEYRELRPFVEEIKRAREAAGLTLAEVSRRCGIDQPALSRLENGHNKNPTLDTLWRCADAVGRSLVPDRFRDFRHPSFGIVCPQPFIHGSHGRWKTTLSGGFRGAEGGCLTLPQNGES